MGESPDARVLCEACLGVLSRPTITRGHQHDFRYVRVMLANEDLLPRVNVDAELLQHLIYKRGQNLEF